MIVNISFNYKQARTEHCWEYKSVVYISCKIDIDFCCTVNSVEDIWILYDYDLDSICPSVACHIFLGNSINRVQ